MRTAAPAGRRGKLALLLGAACCCLPAPAGAQLLRRAPSDWQPPSSSPFMQGAQEVEGAGNKQIFRAPDRNWKPPPFSPFMDNEGDKQIFRRPRGDWQPPSSSPLADESEEGDKQIFRRPRGDWQPPSSSPFADQEERETSIDAQGRPRMRRYLPIAANGNAAPFSLPAEPRRGYIEMDLLLSPGAHYTGGNFVSPDGAYVYYTQDGDGMLRAGKVMGKGNDGAAVQEKQFVHPRSSDADGMAADYAPAGSKLRNLGASPIITVSPDGQNIYALPRGSPSDAKAAPAGDILALGRNTDTGGVRALQDLATERAVTALPCEEGLALIVSADGAWVTAACRSSNRPFLQTFHRNATGHPETGAQKGRLTHVQDLALPDSAASAGSVLVVRAPDGRGLYVVVGEEGGKGTQAVLSYGQNPKTGELRLLQTLGNLYAPNFSIDFGAFDPSGRYLFLGHGSQPSFHSWTASSAFVFSRQPGNDLALYWDPRHPN